MKNVARFISQNCVPVYNRLLMKKQQLQNSLQQLKRKIAEEICSLGVKQEKALKLLDANSVTLERKERKTREYWYLRFWDPNNYNKRRAIYVGTREKALKIRQIWEKFDMERSRILDSMRAIEAMMEEFEEFAEFLKRVERVKE